MKNHLAKQNIDIDTNGVALQGILSIPGRSLGLVIFSHGSGSGRLSPRNNYVAEVLQRSELATILVDLLTEEEDQMYENRFDIDLLTDRLSSVVEWAKRESGISHLPIGLFGASTGAASALRCAVDLSEDVQAVVSRGGRPDLAMDALDHVSVPTLLIVGGEDVNVLELNLMAYKKLRCIKQLSIIPGATHLFEEPGTLEQVSDHAAVWFTRHLSSKHKGHG